MKLSDAEWTVMRALWADAPATARDVLGRCVGETGWAYTTVKTLLARLADKGAVKSERRRNTDWFRPVVTQQKARRAAFRSLLDRAFDGTVGGLLHHIVKDERLSARDLDALRRTLRELEDEESLASSSRGGATWSCSAPCRTCRCCWRRCCSTACSRAARGRGRGVWSGGCACSS